MNAALALTPDETMAHIRRAKTARTVKARMARQARFPNISLRKQPDGSYRPRFQPSKAQRDLGYFGIDLKHGNKHLPPPAPGREGQWYTLDEVDAFAIAKEAEIEHKRATGESVRPPREKRRTVEALLKDWLNVLDRDRSSTRLRPDTIRSYRAAAEAIFYKPETRAEARERRQREAAAKTLGFAPPPRMKEPFAGKMVASIGVPELNDFYLYLKAARGHHMALAVIAAFSAAWTWGKKSTFWRLGPNPRHEIEFDRPEGRIVIFEAQEISALIKAADAMPARTLADGTVLTRKSIGDAIMLGLFTGQRQRDRLSLADEGLFDGRRKFRQSKTKMVVEIKETPWLATRLADAQRRVSELKLKLGLRERPPTVVVDERTGREYDGTTYRHTFAEVRALAIKGSAELGLAPCPSIEGKTDQDLRDTCVTLLYRAGNDLQAIADISGHTYKAVQTIVKHYLARDRRRADAAIDKVVAFMEVEWAEALAI